MNIEIEWKPYYDGANSCWQADYNGWFGRGRTKELAIEDMANTLEGDKYFRFWDDNILPRVKVTEEFPYQKGSSKYHNGSTIVALNIAKDQLGMKDAGVLILTTAYHLTEFKAIKNWMN